MSQFKEETRQFTPSLFNVKVYPTYNEEYILFPAQDNIF